jgi:hypothetical protein
MEKTFEPFKTKGVQFLAVRRDGGNIHIVSDDGRNFGAFQSIKSFKEYLERDGIDGVCLGKCSVFVRPM